MRPFEWLYPVKRWMYPDARPNVLARTLNRMSTVQFRLGWAPSTWVTLEVAGRRTGKTVSCPLVVAVHDDHRYLVAMLGERSNWVSNVRAASGRAVICHGAAEEVWLEEVPAAERPPILRAYLAAAPRARPHLPVAADTPSAEITLIAARTPVFLVHSVLGHGRPAAAGPSALPSRT
jgi:deazaflavin-dependent oxidoreductase (nitroreductase family)